jgi:flagellar protein FlaG
MVSQIQSRNSPQPPAVDLARPAPAQPAAAPIETSAQKVEVRLSQEQVKQNLEVAITRLNEQMRDGGRNVNFSMDQELGRFVVRVTKQDTGEVIRQIPNEAVLKAGHTVEALRGMLHNQVV